MDKDDLSQLQQSRLLQTKHLESKKWCESLQWLQTGIKIETLMLMEMVMQPNPAASVSKPQLSTLIWNNRQKVYSKIAP